MEKQASGKQLFSNVTLIMSNHGLCVESTKPFVSIDRDNELGVCNKPEVSWGNFCNSFKLKIAYEAGK